MLRPGLVIALFASACGGALVPVPVQTPRPAPRITLPGKCDDGSEPHAFNADTTIRIITCEGDEHVSTIEPSMKLRDTTYYLVQERDGVIVAMLALGAWENGPEWGGYGDLVGVLANPRTPVAVVLIAEHSGPDTGSTRVVVYRLAGASFTSIYDRNATVAVDRDHATISECIPSTHATLPGPCERYVDEEARITVLRWNGTTLVSAPGP